VAKSGKHLGACVLRGDINSRSTEYRGLLMPGGALGKPLHSSAIGIAIALWILIAHDLFGKLLNTFPDHALAKVQAARLSASIYSRSKSVL